MVLYIFEETNLAASPAQYQRLVYYKYYDASDDGDKADPERIIGDTIGHSSPGWRWWS